MRNDARPVGEDAHDQSPIDGRETPRDERDSVAHGRESHVVNKEADERDRRQKRKNSDAPTAGK